MERWIKCSDRLPEYGIAVLTFDKYNGCRVDYLIECRGEEPYVWACRLIDDWAIVTHWTLLPKPPEE